MAKRREPTASTPVELKLDIPGNPQPARQEEAGAELNFIPVPMEPRTPEAVFNNLMVREATDPSGPTEPLSPTHSILRKYVGGLTYGDDLSEIKAEVMRIIQHQPEKADAFNALLAQIDQERVVDAVQTRGYCEKRMKRSLQRGDLTSAEVMVVWKISNGIIEEVQGRQGKDKNSSKAVDPLATMEKVDIRHQQEADSTAMQKWKGTTAHGREIIRKKLYELKKEIAASQPIDA